MKTKLIIICALAQLAISCAKKSSENKPSEPPSKQVMVQNDLEKMESTIDPSIKNYDLNNRSYFTKIFGGTDGVALKGYVQQRLHYYFTEDEINSSQINRQIRYSNWQTDNFTGFNAGKAEVGAMYVGAILWLIRTIDEEPLTVKIGNNAIPIESSRNGVMEIGPGYKSSISDSSGKTYSLPTEFRQSILLHEGRHADCTGGLSPAQISTIQKVHNHSEFLTFMANVNCGHLHANCPQGHDLAGMAACDSRAWEAYAVEAVYLNAVLNRMQGDDRRVMEAMAMDAESRVLLGFGSLMNGTYGDPDMSSLDN